MEAILLRQLFSTSPAELLIASIWQGLLLTALAWAVLKLARGLRASTRFTLWLIAFLLVALLPFFALSSAAFGAHPLSATVPQTGFALHLNTAWAFVLEGLWVATSLFSLIRLAAGGRQMRVLFRNSVPVPFRSLDEEIQSIVTRTGSRPVEVRLSDGIDAPSVVGFLHPAVIVPRSLWSELTACELKQIILHEVAHLDRGDDWTNLLQKLLRALCPLNPALFWAERHLCLEREQACDDAVLDTAGNARAYATCLTKLAETRLVKRAAALAPGLWKRHSELAGRVENILHRRRKHGPLFAHGLVAAALVASLSGVLLLQRCPGIITFAGSDTVTRETAVSSVSPSTNSFEYGRPDQLQAHYQEASFHPAVNTARLKLNEQANSKSQAARKVYAAHLRFVELRGPVDEDGEGITLILFTVEAPQGATAAPAAKQTPAPILLTPDNWIVFQI
jgi:beta-lactamase regulating signal transducer with metallopeptidase domain